MKRGLMHPTSSAFASFRPQGYHSTITSLKLMQNSSINMQRGVFLASSRLYTYTTRTARLSVPVFDSSHRLWSNNRDKSVTSVVPLMIRRFATQTNLSELHNLARSYSDSEDYSSAVEVRRQILDIKTRSLGENHVEVVQEMAQLANALMELDQGASTNALREALELRIKIVDAAKNRHGSMHPDVLDPLGNLHASYSSLGLYKEAINAQSKVVDIQTKHLGEWHPETASAIKKLADSYVHVDAETSSYEDGIRLTEKVVKIRVKTLGEEHHQTMYSKDWFLTLLFLTDRNQRVLEFGRDHLERRKKIFGEDDPNTLVLLLLVKTAEARCSQLQSVAKKNATTTYSDTASNDNPDHPAILVSLGRRTLAAFEAKFGKFDRSTINVLMHLSCIYFEFGALEEAIIILRKHTEVNYHIYGRKNPHTLRDMENLALTLSQLSVSKDYDHLRRQEAAVESVKIMEEVVKGAKSLYGENDAHVGMYTYNLYEYILSAINHGFMDSKEDDQELEKLRLRAYQHYISTKGGRSKKK